MQTTPKFNIGQSVELVAFRNRHPEVPAKGIIQSRSRYFANPNGLNVAEYEISSIRLPYRFDGKTLEVEFPEQRFGHFCQPAYTSTFTFKGWMYAAFSKEYGYVQWLTETDLQ